MTEAAFQNIILFFFLAVAVIVLGRNAYGKRHWIAWNIFKFIVCFAGFLGVMVLAKVIGLHGWWVQYVAMGLTMPFFSQWQWERARQPPAEIRRRVIAKWEARTGLQYDPKAYELDHKIPFARHGWHTMDNLRVIRRDANRRKGGSEPRLEDWLRIWRRKDEV